MCEWPGLLITSSFLDSQLLLLRLRLSFITTNFLSSSPRETNICQNIFHITQWQTIKQKKFSSFLKKKSLTGKGMYKLSFPSFSSFLLLLRMLEGYDFFSSNSSWKAGICQYVGRWNQNSATFVVLESRSGGLYARLSPFNLHNIRVVEQVSQLGIHNTSSHHGANNVVWNRDFGESFSFGLVSWVKNECVSDMSNFRRVFFCVHVFRVCQNFSFSTKECVWSGYMMFSCVLYIFQFFLDLHDKQCRNSIHQSV